MIGVVFPHARRLDGSAEFLAELAYHLSPDNAVEGSHGDSQRCRRLHIPCAANGNCHTLTGSRGNFELRHLAGLRIT